MSIHGMERITDAIGYLVLKEDGAVISSAGELENDEHVASVMAKMVDVAIRLITNTEQNDSFRKLTVLYNNFMYSATIAKHRIYISKREYMPPDAIPV